jgi:hypothetical protein
MLSVLPSNLAAEATGRGRLHDADAEAFRAYKDRLIDYLQRFITDLVATGAEIAGLVARGEEAGVEALLAAAYRHAAALGAGRPLEGEPAACTWDAELAEVMRRTGRAVEEERVLDDLLDDLAVRPAS